MDKNLLRQVIYEQRERSEDLGVLRFMSPELISCPEVVVITGVRRCGKSVLMQQILSKQEERDYYLNFDDERLITFKVDDFQKLNEVFMEDFGVQKHYYLDEIQNIDGWERFVSRLYRQGCKVFVTGSNAKLLSREMGTFLTGRHVTKELYPFSFKEYLEYNNTKIDKSTFHTTTGKSLLISLLNKYLKSGGFPQYIKQHNDNYLFSLYNDIIYKDVVVRNNIYNDKQLKEMMYYLASNATHRFTYNSVAKAINIKSADTIKAYIGFIEDTYMIRQLSKYDYSAGAQTRSPRKIYLVDNSFIHKIGFSATDNVGSSLENLVCVELMRRNKDIYYYEDNYECDFIVRKGNVITEAIQVTLSLANEQTRKREMKGLVTAMKAFGLKEGLIITYEEHEDIEPEQGILIHVRPLWKWLLDR